MAYDFLMLQRYQPTDAIRIRHYNWSRPSYSFGLSQKFSYIESEASNLKADFCRRPTGGGLVDHSDDWTYALVIPSSHPVAGYQPIEIYKLVHQAIMEAMRAQGIACELQPMAHADALPGVCFNKPELYDVVLSGLPSKVAGAAQKRAKAGFLMQGSIWRPVVSSLAWERFYNDFLLGLAQELDANIQYVDAPTWVASEVDSLVAQFDSDDWNQRR